MKKAVRNLVSHPLLQPVAMQLLKLCHAAMNYGGGQSVKESGELAALRFVQARVPVNTDSPFILFDVGANDGGYLKSALPILGPDVRAWSFEPQSTCFQLLSQQFAKDGRVVLRNIALSDRQEEKEIFFDATGETTASFHHPAGSGPAQFETVPGTTLDEICRTEGIERIHFLKIDTEGHEMQVLLGAARMLQKGAIQAIQFEFGDTFLNTRYHFVDLWQLLSPDFRIFRILRHGLSEIALYSSDLEIYKIANFLCVHK
jgi:FkbM family methyltransferase